MENFTEPFQDAAALHTLDRRQPLTDPPVLDPAGASPGSGAEVPADQTSPPPEATAGISYPAAAAEAGPERLSKGKLIFVIDDAGNNLSDLDPFLEFPGPLTIAVLPGLPNSAEAARRIRAVGKEVFLHQPMQSLGGNDPGPGAVFSGMDEDDIRSIVNRNLDEIWPVAGMNNHEGSRVSADEKIMEILLTICGERGILFLDSRTTPQTTAPGVAGRLGINIAERDVFLDNEKDRDSMTRYLNMGLRRAEQKGSAVMIGHATTPGLASLLGEFYAVRTAENYTFLTATAFVTERP